MGILAIDRTDGKLHIKLQLPDCRFAALCSGDRNAPLSDYAPIAVILPDSDGNAEYTLSSELMLPETATHIYVLPELSVENALSARIPTDEASTDEASSGEVSSGVQAAPELVFYAISDLHTVIKGGRRLRDCALSHIAKARPAFVLAAGDLANGAQSGEYSILKREIDERLAGIPLLVTFGNHDFHANSPREIPDPAAREEFSDFIRARNTALGVTCEYFDRYNFAVTLGGAYIVALQGLDCGDRVYSIGEPMLERLDRLLTENRDKRRVILSHYPLTQSGRLYLRENVKLGRLLERHGSIMYFAGHTHDSLDSERIGIRTLGSVTHINTASVGNTEPCAFETRRLKAFRSEPELEKYFRRRSMGIRAELYDSQVILRGVDFEDGLYIPRAVVKLEL